jgi:uncharacterized protein DUF3883
MGRVAWNEVSDRAAVLSAISEFDALGEREFFKRHHFGPARTQVLIHEGREYPSKAILGVAHGYQFPAQGALRSEEFTGGEHTVKRVLRRIGFDVRAPRSRRADDALTIGHIYTRQDLRARFSISDATINNGVYPRRGDDSVWLFVTEDKTPDRTQFQDLLVGDTLYWDGQLSGRTDGLIIEHEARGQTLAVFYRKSRYEFTGAGFRYEGHFHYVEHSGQKPAHFVFERLGSDSDIVRTEREIEDFVRARGRRGRSAEEIKLIERHAVDMVAEHYRRLGWMVEDVGDTMSYDLRCSKGHAELHVEVKGTTTMGERVVLTRKEARHARVYPLVALAVVRDVRLEMQENGSMQAVGGQSTILDPWLIDDGVLEPLAFEYTLPVV